MTARHRCPHGLRARNVGYRPRHTWRAVFARTTHHARKAQQ